MFAAGTQAESAATPLVLVHPVNTGALVWDQVATALAVTRSVAVPDLRGHGFSVKQGPFGVTDYAADVLAVMDSFGFSRAHLAGASIGGPVGVFLAAHTPDRVSSIASFGGALRLRISDDDFASIARLLKDRGVGRLLEQMLPDAVGPASRSAELIARATTIAQGQDRSAEVVLAIIREAFVTDVAECADSCRVPALVANGTEDTTCTVADGRLMAERLGVEPIVLDRVAHLPMLEAPYKLIELLENHLAEVEATDSA